MVYSAHIYLFCEPNVVCYRLMWIWKKADWPIFRYDLSMHQAALDRLIDSSKEILGRIEALPSEAQSDALIDLVVSEEIRTSFVEGQDLDRVSVRASVRHLGGLSMVKPLTKDHRANGISSLLLDVVGDGINHCQMSSYAHGRVI